MSVSLVTRGMIQDYIPPGDGKYGLDTSGNNFTFQKKLKRKILKVSLKDSTIINKSIILKVNN